MAIVKMEHVRLIGMTADRERILQELLKLGCVEISEPAELLADEQWSALVERDYGDRQELRDRLASVNSAIAVLDRYAPSKSGLFRKNTKISEGDFFSDADRAAAHGKAADINAIEARVAELSAEAVSLQNLRSSLSPWAELKLPLNTVSTEQTVVAFGTVSSIVSFEQLEQEVSEVTEACCMELVSKNADMLCLSIICYKPEFPAVESLLRGYGYTAADFSGFTGLAVDNLAVIDAELGRVAQDIQKTKEHTAIYREDRPAIELEIDRLTQELSRQEARDRLLLTDSAFMIEGWVPAEEKTKLEKALSAFDSCIYEFSEPTEDEYPKTPVKLKNNWFTRPLNAVTEMYSLPQYGSVDPNPVMAPFFILFYGIMMADMGYGILMMLGGLFMLKAMKGRGARNFAGLLLLCGASTFVVGALTGGFFGDFLTQLTTMVSPDNVIVLPALFTPLDDTIAILIGSLVLGLIQIITGMTISVVEKIRHGNFIDALFDEITWWIILAGAALAILGIGSVNGIPVVLIVGALMLAIGGTRNARGFGKVSSLVGLVYNGVSGFFSDTLSYARLMALMLAGSVVAQVFNTLGSVIGNVFIFVLISFAGNMINFALNILGCFVHDLRLQCLEYFNRFYKDGGRAFSPLSINTKYTDIIKEEI